MSDTSTNPARARGGERRREELLDAAEELFTDKGVTATTVADITARAEVAKGTFYLYFESKDHVVAGLHERAVEGMARIIEQALDSRGGRDFDTLIDQLTASIITYWIEQRDLYRAIREGGESRKTAEVLATHDRRITGMLEAGIRDGIDSGRAAVGDPARAARFIYYGCQGATTTALLAPGSIDQDPLIASSQEIIHKMLSP